MKEKEPLTITGEHNVTIELHENSDSNMLEVYAASSKVGEISPEQLYSVANNEKIVIPKDIIE